MGPEAIQVPQLCRYIMLRIRLTATAYVHHVLHIETDALLSAVSDLPPIDHIFGREGTLRYLSALLTRTAQLRDAAQWSNYHPAVRAGLHCIEQRFTDSALTLNEVAEAAGLSPNYFSTLFRKEVGCTFGEYLTQIRMRRARQLLRSTPQRTAQVARAVGYQDTHYFSNLFRKTQGCAPRDFRAQANSATQRRPPAGER
jgi:two-component system response regulator YesN